MKKILSVFSAFVVMSVFALALSESKAASAEAQELAVNPVSFLQLEITSTCTDKGSLFRIINRGQKWPRNGVLHVYFADDQSSMTERRIRLAPNQKVSFVIDNNKSAGRPVGMWIEPEWYKRDFAYDAKTSC
ncbi:MAG: hypothetical protein OEX17_08970 [Rhodospirillaceae bacterium]|nr:hypothetical protein [Rhodospirillaceae bacterium]